MTRPSCWTIWLLLVTLSSALLVPTVRDFSDGDDNDTDDNETYDCSSIFRVGPFDLPLPMPLGSQQNPEWALSELCSATKRSPFQPSPFDYDDSAGGGVDVYVFDSGVTSDQDQFGGRVIDEVNVSDEPFADQTGHGSKVASLIASRDYGVAKQATIRSVKFRENGRPNYVRFVRAMNQVIALHNTRKGQPGFKGSVVNMSFKTRGTAEVIKALDDASAAGISLVASAGNEGYDNNHYPSAHPKVISVGGSTRNYEPRYLNPSRGSNFGQDVIQVWAPGQDVQLWDPSKKKQCGSGTSYASAYVTGILAIFYGVEGPNLTPDGARDLLFANADNYIDLTPKQPSGAPVNWHNSPTIMANTGYLKGQALNPPQPFLPKGVSAPPPPPPPPPPPQSSPTAVQGCQSPNHDDPLVHFTLSQGDAARRAFSLNCGITLTKGKTEGCTVYFNPCSESFGAKAVDVIVSVEQISWKDGKDYDYPAVQEISDALGAIMNDCDTTTTTEKWGGFKSVEVESGVRMYNVTANQNGQYPKMSDKWATWDITTGDEDCKLWDSA